MRLFVLAAIGLIPPPALASPDDSAVSPAYKIQHADHCGLPAGEGAVMSIDVAKARVTVSHDAIKALGWDKADSEVAASKSVDLSAFTAGDKVHFLLASERKGKPALIVAMCAADAEAGAHEACMNSMHETAIKAAAAQGKDCEASSDTAGKTPQSGHSGHH